MANRRGFLKFLPAAPLAVPVAAKVATVQEPAVKWAGNALNSGVISTGFSGGFQSYFLTARTLSGAQTLTLKAKGG